MRLDQGFGLDPSITYLNHGSYGACPAAVLEAQARYRDRMEAAPVRFLAHELEGLLDDARRRIGAFVRADPEGLAFVPNATTGVSTVLRSLRFEPGDELLACDHEYNATINALNEVARRDGARVVIPRLPFPVASADDLADALLEAVTPRTRLVLVSEATSPTALLMPVGRIVAELNRMGIDALVDSAHGPGMLPLDVDGLAPAYWTANGHKWLCGPKGSAVLWVREDRRDRVAPLTVSHGWNDPREARGERSAFRLRFDWTGTFDPSPWLAMADAIEIVGRMLPGGWPAIRAANHDLVIAGRNVVAEALGVETPAPDELIGSMAVLPVPGLEDDATADQLHEALYGERIEVPIYAWPVPAARPGGGNRGGLIRLSAHLYNELADYERLAGVLSRLTQPAAR